MAMYYQCPKCFKSREATERIETKDGKSWLIEYCFVCKWNFDISEYNKADKKPNRFRFRIRDNNNNETRP